jgi:hypothetical protein
VEPASFTELEQFCSGVGYDLSKYDTVVLDGFSYLTDGLIKDQVLSINTRSQGNTGKRSAGVLELDDYGILSEYERRLLARILQLDKHVIVSCLQDMYQPFSASPPRPEKMGGPDLPGSMRSGSAAMFDVVMKLNTRKALRDPKDAKSAYLERYWLTESDGQYICKSRLRNGTKPIFPTEVPFDVDRNIGTFGYFLETALKAYNGN